MKFFITYRFTGEEPSRIKQELRYIGVALKKMRHTYWHSLALEKIIRKKKLSNAKILQMTLKKLVDADAVLAFIKSDRKSEGMLLEIGYALARKKKLIVLIRKGVKTSFLREIADSVVEFS